MPNRVSNLLRFTAIAAALALGACGPRQDEGNLAGLGNGVAGKDADPALINALHDQIAADRNLDNQSNRNAVRTAETPSRTQYPEPAVGRDGAGRPPVRPAGGGQVAGGPGCPGAAQFDYNMKWAGRMPALLPLYPGGRIAEAAGSDRGGCRMRVVSFTTADAPPRVIDYYDDRAVRAGYSSERQTRGADSVLGGTNADGGAFYVIVTPLRSGGSDVALIANNGR